VAWDELADQLSSDDDFVVAYKELDGKGEGVNLQPLYDRVVVEVAETDQTTAGGIIIPDNVRETPQRARVVAVGPGPRTPDGAYVPMGIEVGDEILFGKYAGTEYKLGGQDYLILRENDVLAKIGE
jgi:chaperonin GroES